LAIKTGNTDQAGGVFLSASTTTVDHKTVAIVTAVLGAPTLWQALDNSLPLIRSAQTNFSANTLVPANNVVGRYRLHLGWQRAGSYQDGHDRNGLEWLDHPGHHSVTARVGH